MAQLVDPRGTDTVHCHVSTGSPLGYASPGTLWGGEGLKERLSAIVKMEAKNVVTWGRQPTGPCVGPTRIHPGAGRCSQEKVSQTGCGCCSGGLLP